MKDVEFRFLTEKGIKEAQKLRYAVYVLEKCWEPKNGYGIEFDKFDRFSYHFGVFRKNELIAYSRLINGNLISLPISKHVKIKSKNNVEVSRVIQNRIGNINPVLITSTMYYNMFLFVIEKGFEKIYAIVKESHFRALKILYNKFFCVKKIGEKFLHKDEYRIPILIELKSLENFIERFAMLGITIK